jgi:hypothetical protein
VRFSRLAGALKPRNVSAMPYLIRLPVLFLLLVVAGADLRAQLKADPTALTLGTHQQEQTVNAEVKLTNSGSTALEITGVMADCSCTAATPEKHTLGPGESTSLKISIGTRSYDGVLHRNVHVQTSDGEITIPIELTVSLFKFWQLNPSTIIIPPSKKGQEGDTTVALQYIGSGKAELGKIVSTPDWLEVVPTNVGKGLFRLRFIKHADTPAGNYTVRVVVQTSDPVEPSLAFNVFVPISSSLRVVPNPVVLPTVKVGQATTREITIQGWTGPVAPRLELTRGEVKALVREDEKYRFELSVTPDFPGPFTQLLRIYDEQKLEAEIPIILRAEPIEKTK